MKYDIWEEGYSATGEHAAARCIARDVEAENFQEACIKVCADRDPLLYGEFDAEKLTVWGCRLYTNGEEAGALFG